MRWSRFFFLRVHAPPRCSLFPYTTLFRSTTGDSIALSPRLSRHCEVIRVSRSTMPTILSPAMLEAGATTDYLAIDRKSTRLNSSHLGISYAVFCLKKKTGTGHCDVELHRR